MRALRLVGVLAVLACHATAGPKSPAPVASAAPVPALLDLTRVPDRPQLRVVGHSSIPAHRDSGAMAVGPTALLDSAYDTAIENPIVLDTNDARLYYEAGLAARNVDPAGASAAFYWASRLDPSWAQPYFARWYLLKRIVQARTISLGPSAAVPIPDSIRVRIDSLAVAAFSRDPFFDDGMIMGDMSRQLRTQVGIYNATRHAVIGRINDNRLRVGQPPLIDNSSDATVPHEWYIAYGNRDFAGAARLLAPVIKRHPDALVYYVYRAKAQFFQKQYDSAAATMQAAVTRVHTAESTKTLPVYFSKEAFTYAIGMAQQLNGHDSAARAAYQQTVTENLGFYMAHLHLAYAAIGTGDTATALTEARLAAEIRGDDPVVQLFLGYALLNAGQSADAATHLDAAVRADSAYALPYLYLGQARLTEHDTTGAALALRGFLARARRDDDNRQTAQGLVDAFATRQSVSPSSTHP